MVRRFTTRLASVDGGAGGARSLAKAHGRPVSYRKKFGDHAGAQDNFPTFLLLEGTSYAYGGFTRGSPVEDGT
jgi:hypothetical protein